MQRCKWPYTNFSTSNDLRGTDYNPAQAIFNIRY